MSEENLTQTTNQQENQQDQPWYVNWFDTSYYHLLYKNRNDQEAQDFIKVLCEKLALEPKVHILDLACGKGRHSVFLNRLGYRVTGQDLSKNNIIYAQKFQTPTLDFSIRDILEKTPQTYDVVLNLFTSFGYFEEEQDDITVLENIKANLKPKGVGVLDFMNAYLVTQNILPQETKTVEGVVFNITREIQDGFVFKYISFQDPHHLTTSHTFIEQVKLLTLSKFQAYFKQVGLSIKGIYGDYTLQPFVKETTKRLILVFEHE